ncbi:DUF5007 domain-containing protein [Sinomicrobium weinanense]|uniref:DUF5007 domain-containing protein n=1 Tax=Sinomicrobium weinanense TaxID=2842200 RepID=A0A926JPH6_9FLAO|nr:DUF5007 domain-containing protein [Sinomicrobium weinanense]MBC9795001.1 DUF5007 domain-containing protein [Sinomicrobium weinanense]MBU3125138.1 DUF5007 domain-containing protein [Sinomicrobium weinanense]
MKNIIYYLMVIALVVSCSPPEVGYISDDIHALEDTIFVPRGVFTKGAAPAIEGSTYPIHWEITGVTDGQGNSTNALFEEYELLVWKESFNADTDTTLALVEEKLELADKPTILINDVSGELAFSQASEFVTDHDIFHVNMKATNVKGEREFDDFVVVKLEPFKAVVFPTEMRSGLQLGKDDGSWNLDYTSTITNDFDDNVPSVLDGSHPYFSIQKTSDEPAVGVKVKMIITDSYDNPLNPEKVAFYPSDASYLQNYHDNSVETVSDDTSTTFSLPAPPFPQFSRSYQNGPSSYLMYYLSTEDAFTVDKEAYEADNGAKDWAPYTDPETGEIRNRAYIRWGIKIIDSGTWEIKMRIPYTKVKE